MNDVAVGITRVRSEGRLGRVAIVDVDVHQGNGTAAIFADDGDTFTEQGGLSKIAFCA